MLPTVVMICDDDDGTDDKGVGDFLPVNDASPAANK